MEDKKRAVKKLLGRVPDRRFSAYTVLGRMTELYPGFMHPISEHLVQRIEEAGGDDCPPGRRLAITLEGELLALRNILLAQILEDGVITKKNDVHKNLKTVLHITDQISRLTDLIGLSHAPLKPSELQDYLRMVLETTGSGAVEERSARDKKLEVMRACYHQGLSGAK